jgi:hypothetical protein
MNQCILRAAPPRAQRGDANAEAAGVVRLTARSRRSTNSRRTLEGMPRPPLRAAAAD